VTREVVAAEGVPALIRKFEEEGEPYKAEILTDIMNADAASAITVYHQGDFSDLCRGPHVPATGLIKHFKLLNVAGAYWRGSATNKTLQRIYRPSYSSEADPKPQSPRLEEAAKRAHRKLGRELDLCSVPEVTGPGLSFWHPRGALIRSVIED